MKFFVCRERPIRLPFPKRDDSSAGILASNGYYTPGSGEHGPRFLTGGPGAAPGGVASKNGWVYMRVQGGFNLHSRESLCVCVCVVKQPLVSKMGCAKGCAFAEAGRGINSAA